MDPAHVLHVDHVPVGDLLDAVGHELPGDDDDREACALHDGLAELDVRNDLDTAGQLQVVETFAEEIGFGVGGLRAGLLLVEGLPLRATGSTEVRVAWAPTAKPARRKAPPAQRTSRSLPVSTSNTNPRMASLWGMNGLLSRRATL